MNPIAVVLAGLLLAVVVHPAKATTLELHYGTETRFSAPRQTALESAAIRLLESSNFNSERHAEILKSTPKLVHAAYRKALAGRYLVVSFDSPRQVGTIGGVLDVAEIVVGLNRPDHADSLFTVDPQGRVVSHGKFSGALAIEVLHEARKERP